MNSWDAEIYTKEQWTKYKLSVDSQYGVYHEHREPERYPFRVCTERWPDDDGRIADKNRIHHEFIYKQSVPCDKCGHASVVWPDGSK